MPVTSVDIDSDLLEAAKATFHVRTNKEVIRLALEEAVGRQRQLDAIRVLSDLTVDVDATQIEYRPDAR